MAEAILNRKGRPNFVGYSAGSHPSGQVRPEALRQIESARMPVDGFRSKSWDEFAKPGAPQMDFVITVCDAAAAEVCPVWPGKPHTAHWGIPDPGNLGKTPEELTRAFFDAFVTLGRRIDLFLSLPFEKLDALALKREVTRIGRES